MEKHLLRDVTDVFSGTSFVKKPVHDASGDYLVLESYALNPDGSINTDKLLSVSSKTLSKPKQALLPNDLLVRAKGTQHTAALYKPTDSPLPVFATSYFLFLRISDLNLLIPEYLVLHINQPDTQKRLSLCAKGSTVRHISKTTLMDFEIDIPPLQKQRKLVELATLRTLENKLRRQIDELRSEYLNSVTFNYLAQNQE